MNIESIKEIIMASLVETDGDYDVDTDTVSNISISDMDDCIEVTIIEEPCNAPEEDAKSMVTFRITIEEVDNA